MTFHVFAPPGTVPAYSCIDVEALPARLVPLMSTPSGRSRLTSLVIYYLRALLGLNPNCGDLLPSAAPMIGLESCTDT